jgi:hypothetical protein
LLAAGFLLALWSGCHSFHSYRPVTVQAIDAETKKPIPQAEVCISYPLGDRNWAPYPSDEKTGSDGIAHLRAVPYGKVDLTIAATASGYADEARSVPVTAIEALPGFSEKASTAPVQRADFVVELYAKPAPSIDLVLPTGYRGLVRAKLKIQDDLVYTPGQRVFPCAVPGDNNVVDVLVPPLFRRTPFPEFHAHYPDSPPLSPHVRLSEVGFWWLRSDGDTQIFLVGTEKEHSDYLAADRASGTRDSSGSGGGGRGKGGGRKNRGGGSGSNSQPAPDGGSM